MNEKYNKYTFEFKIKLLNDTLKSSIKEVAIKYGVKETTLWSWYYKYKEAKLAFKKDETIDEESNRIANYLIKIKFLYDKKPDKKKTFIKINKIRKQQNIKLKSILKILNISESTYRRRMEKDKSFEKNRKDTQNIKLIKKEFNNSRGQFGYRRLKEIIFRNHKIIMNKKLIYRLMRKIDLKPKYIKNKRRAKHKTGKNKFNVPDLIQRNFKSIKKRFTVLYTDVSYLDWENSRAYESTIIDAATGEIIDYRMSYKNNANLVTRNLKNALNRIKKQIGSTEGIIIHSDHALCYESKLYRDMCLKNGLRISMGAKYQTADNNVIESFHSLLKKGTIHSNKKSYKTLKNYINDVIGWLIWYNKNKSSNIKLYWQKII